MGIRAPGSAHRGLTRFWDRNHYRTFTEQPGQPTGYMSVQAEVGTYISARWPGDAHTFAKTLSDKLNQLPH